jgi:6-phosphogluconolactonase
MSEEIIPEEIGFDGDSALQSLPGARVIVPDVEDLVDAVAKDMAAFAHRRVLASGEFHLALSGGSTPQVLYRRLMIDPRYRLFPWRRTHLWIVDERCVTADDDRSNFKMIRELLVEHCEIPPTATHPMPALEAGGDRRYESELREALKRSGGRLDYVLLGMGADAHTASLFPGTPALEESERWIVFNDGPTVSEPRPRLTMTFPIINGARRLGILITGSAKHAAIQQVAGSHESGRPDLQRLPITGVRPLHADAELTWYLDHPAALGR